MRQGKAGVALLLLLGRASERRLRVDHPSLEILPLRRQAAALLAPYKQELLVAVTEKSEFSQFQIIRENCRQRNQAGSGKFSYFTLTKGTRLNLAISKYVQIQKL